MNQDKSCIQCEYLDLNIKERVLARLNTEDYKTPDKWPYCNKVVHDKGMRFYKVNPFHKRQGSTNCESFIPLNSPTSD